MAAIFVGCHSQAASVQSAEFFVFGTTVSLKFNAAPGAAAAIERDIAQHLQRRHREWHAWEPGALVTLNQSIARGAAATTTPSIAALIRSGQQLARRSGGLFDPGVGKLVALWGFHSSDWPIRAPPPDEAQLAAFRQQPPSISQLSLRANVVQTTNRAVQLDFGGLAKGAAADEVMDLLRAAGVRRALIELGGDVSAINAPNQPRWRVGIRDPSSPDPLGGVMLDDGESLFTSGTYARYSLAGGERMAHILDPRTARPARGLRSASVLTHDALTADAAATALIVAGREWQRTARALGVDAVLVIDEGNICTVTPKMAARLIARSAAGERCAVVAL